MKIDKQAAIGIDATGHNVLPEENDVVRIKLQLLFMGFDVENFEESTRAIISPIAAQVYLLRGNEKTIAKCPSDRRIENFLRNYLHGIDGINSHTSFLPREDFICDRHGISRILSLPEKSDEFHSEYVDSYKLYNGILHNPSTDKRTTAGTFHVVEGGLPVPMDKKEVPKTAFARMLRIAFQPSDKDILSIPFASEQRKPIQSFISNYMKPLICPEIKSVQGAKSMEIRFFVPGSLVNILDCTESIFGNAGSPLLPENDSALDPITWTGHTGCIVFAPQLRKCTKKSLGLPHISKATERQKRDGMCWANENDLYHDGKPFKIVARDGGGVIISIVADSYNGYGKKEVKTQMSYAANMLGMCEEEHSGGALVFPRYDLGDVFNFHENLKHDKKFMNVAAAHSFESHSSEGFSIDKNFSNILYLPENSTFSLPKFEITVKTKKKIAKISLEIGKFYILPCGYMVHIERPDGRYGRWKLIGTSPDGVLCYRPATVSGGGKSEIAKSIGEFISAGPTIIHNLHDDFEFADKILATDFSRRFRDAAKSDDRKLLDDTRSFGSVLKLLTPNECYTNEYNAWLKSIPQHILELIFSIKRFSKHFGAKFWQKLFSVAKINGKYGNELLYNGEKLFEHYIRVGFDYSHHSRLFSLRDDYIPSMKIQLADDITVSTTFANSIFSRESCTSVKIFNNCEHRLYQRPDEAVSPGYDAESERDMTERNVFMCNFKPLTRDDVKDLIKNRTRFELYSAPMKNMLESFVSCEDEIMPKYIVCPSELRVMPDGSVSKNQRYLQNCRDTNNSIDVHLAKIAAKLWHKIDQDFDMVELPVRSILSGRRNNPPEAKVRPLCVYGPLHYMEIPELFIEYMTSITGKSPSTTGMGLEGAMTKGPFNCISSIYDLNNALLSFILTEASGFTLSAGYVGPHMRVDHDITYIFPEIWSRMSDEERCPKFLIKHGYLERCENFYHDGFLVQAERLGYRMTRKFLKEFAARVFSFPDAVFSDRMLRPEEQGIDIFVDSMRTILEAHRQAAELLMKSPSINDAIPPLLALLSIIVDGKYNGMTLNDLQFRAMFFRENVINSDWYLARLKKYQAAQLDHFASGLKYLKSTVKDPHEADNREREIKKVRNFVKSKVFLKSLIGTIGK